MSINPVTQYPGKVAPATPDNPFGTARNITIPGDGTGTPWESALLKDEWALHHAMLLNAGMKPNGTPDSAENSQLFKAAKASIGNGANRLSNHNFLIASPDDSQPPPDATPRSYPPGFQIFSNVFANETIGISNLTYIDGRVSFSGGDFYMPATNSGGLERLTELTASVADFDGKPRTRGVSFALVGNEYRVTVGVDALEDAGAVLTPLGSVKFEQGSVATGHEVQSAKGRDYTFNTVAEMVLIGAPIGALVTTMARELSVISDWEITQTISTGEYGILLDSGLYAKLLTTDGNILHYGAAPYMPPSVTSRIDSKPAIEAALSHVGFFTTPKGGRWLCGGPITVTRGMRLQGLGCLPDGVYTDLIFTLAQGEDSFTYSDGGDGYPQGDVKIYDLCVTNEVVDDLSQFPDPADVISGKNRAWWSVNDQPFVDETTWIEKKTGGANCPHLDIKNVMLRYFFIGCDTHSWMSNIQNLQTRYCGVGLRIYGTSTNVTSFWPQYPLISGAQVRLEYSEFSSTSTGEQPVTGYTESVYGIELHGGQCTISATGMELACKAQYLIYNGRYRIENNWSSTVDGFKPLYIFDIAAYPDLTIAGGFDYRTYVNSYMRTDRLDNIDGIKHENPIYPWFLSSTDSQFNTLTKVTEDGGDKYRGIFGKMLSQVNEAQLLPYSRNNRSLNAGVSEEENSKAEYIAHFDTTLDGSAETGLRVLYDTSGYTAGDKLSGSCTITPMVAIASDGSIAKYPTSLTQFVCTWSGVKTATGYELYISDLPGDFTSSIIMAGSGGTEAIVTINAGDATMTAPQKDASQCRFIVDARSTAPGSTVRDYIIDVASS